MGAIVVRNDNVAALTSVTNILAGSQFEFIPEAPLNLVKIYQVASASGMRSSVFVDTETVFIDNEIPFIATSVDNSATKVTEFMAYGGSRLSITLRETANVATTDVLTKVEIEPIPTR